MKKLITGAAALFAALAVAGVAQAADGCAVSQANGSATAGAGIVDGAGSEGIYEVGLSGTLPIGCRLGVQLDVQGVSVDSVEQYSAAGHFFARDPSRYLIGVTGAYADGDSSPSVNFAGVEGEYYFDRWTVSAVVGASDSDVLGGDDFFNAAISYYPTDNLRLTASNLHAFGGDLSGLRAEWQPAGRAFSLFADAQGDLDNSNFGLYKVGARFYFGAGSKSLKERNRQDDPESLLSTFGAWYNLSLGQYNILTGGNTVGSGGSGSGLGSNGFPVPVNGTCPAGFYYVPSLDPTLCYI